MSAPANAVRTADDADPFARRLTSRDAPWPAHRVFQTGNPSRGRNRALLMRQTQSEAALRGRAEPLPDFGRAT